MRQFPVPPRHEELLDKVFGPDNWHEDKALKGFSGASVYQITYRNQPVIVKIAHPAVIQRERDGYHEFVLDNLHHHAPKLGEYYESDDRQEAILRYTYAGSVARSQTLFEFLKGSVPKMVREACTILGKMFTIKQNEQRKSWWERAERKSIRCAEYYDRWLPVQLELEQLPAVGDGATVLQADKLSLSEIAKLTAGDFVELQGFRVEKEEAGVITLYVGRPQAPTLRVKVKGIHNTHEVKFPLIYAVVKETRKMLLERYAENAMGAFSMRSPYFTVEEHEYVNPFYYLDELLGARYNTYIATIHGDLNLRNILVEEKAPAAHGWVGRHINRLFSDKIYDWWLIDFASTQTGPVLLDLQWLEAQVINWLLAPALQRAGQNPHDLAQVLEGLHKRRKLIFQLRTVELRMVYTLLQEIRRLAAGYLAEPEHNPDRWQEYYRGLTLALAATLKQEALKTELGEQAPKFALVAAATTVRWTGEVSEQHRSWREQFRLLMTPGVTVLCLALLCLGLVYYRPSLLRPWQPTPTPLILTPTPIPPTPSTATSAPIVSSESLRILARVQNRKYLLCGVNGNLPLFSWDPQTPKHGNWDPANPTAIDAYENAEGFDADFCRVIATAIFGDHRGRVKFVNLGAQERFQAVTDGVVDLLVRNTTWTPDRDSGLGIDFAAINFYTKQGLLVPKNLNFKSWADLAGKRICVLPNTTTQANLTALREKMKWKLITGDDDVHEFTSTRQAVRAFQEQVHCEAFTSDIAQLTAFYRKPKPDEEMPYLSPDDYVILDILDPAIPDEPRALVVPANDNQWRKVVSYAAWATIYAEELGITQRNVDDSNTTDELRFKEFLGLPDPLIPVGGQIGELLDLSPRFARDIIATMGNYGEIYTRHLSDYLPDRGVNQSGKLSPAGRLFAPPFVLAQLATPTPNKTPHKTLIDFPVVIGIAIDLKDKESLLGDNQGKAANVAEKLYQHAIPGVEITLATENTNSSPEDAQSAVDRLIKKEVLFIVGPTLSSQAKVVDPIANAEKIPMIGPSNTAKGIAQLGCYISRVSPPVTQLVPFALAQAYYTQPTTGAVAVAYLQGNAFTEDEAQIFIEEATRTDLSREWRLVHTETYTNAEIDFSGHATNLIEAKPDLIMIAGLTKDGGLLTQKLRENHYTGLIVGGNGFNTTGIFNVCKGACNGIILAQAYDSRRDRATGINVQFIKAYEQAYQSYPSPIAAQMFTAIQVGVEALQRIDARTQGGLATLTLPVLRDELNKEILAGEPFSDTPLGEIDFAADGEVIQQQFYGAQIVIDANGENGRFETLNEYANGTIDALEAAPSDCSAGYLP